MCVCGARLSGLTASRVIATRPLPEHSCGIRPTERKWCALSDRIAGTIGTSLGRTTEGHRLADDMVHQTGADRIVPDGVISVVRKAITGGLLSSVESLGAGLTEDGWTRATEPGLWRYTTDPSWAIVSGSHAPNVSVFLSGQDEVVLSVADRLRDRLDRGDAGELHRTIHDPHWTVWAGGEVVVSLNATSARKHDQFVVGAMVQLAIERSDTPAEGLPPDPQRARRIARSGTPLQRWYLAGERDLPDDVVALLRDDEDPDVSAAMNAIRSGTTSR